MSKRFDSGQTNISLDVQIVDDTGLPVTGLVAATFPTVKRSSGTGADATITLSDLTALTDAHSDGGVKERGEGVYRLDLPDLADGTHKIRGEATDKRLICEDIQIGIATTLPSIPANWITAAGIAADAITAAKVAADLIAAIQSGLATSSELAKVPKSDGTVAFNATAVSGIQSGLATASALATAQADLDIITGTDGVTLATSQPNYAPATSAQATAIEADTQDLQTQIGTAGAGLTALGDTRLGNLDAAVSTRLASASYTAPLDAAGTRTAVGLSSANLDTQLGNIVADTNELQADWADGGRLDLILDARASQTSVDDVPTNVELAAAIITGLTTALTEGYRGTGATGSVRDLLYELLANITEFTISGATKTVKKLDGSTTAKTYTLDDATTPTGITETT